MSWKFKGHILRAWRGHALTQLAFCLVSVFVLQLDLVDTIVAAGRRDCGVGTVVARAKATGASSSQLADAGTVNVLLSPADLERGDTQAGQRYGPIACGQMMPRHPLPEITARCASGITKVTKVREL